MRLARKLVLLAAMALAALALTATTASAQLTVQEEHGVGDNEPCPAAGCHLEVDSEHHIPMVAHTAGGPVTLQNCNWHLEMRLASNGVGSVTEMKLTPEVPPSTPTCTRAACDNAAGVQTPWPLTIAEPVPGQEIVETTICLRTINSGPGGAGTQCELHFPLSTNANHQYEIGDESTYICENLPNVSFTEIHLVNEVQGPGESKEDVEIVH